MDNVSEKIQRILDHERKEAEIIGKPRSSVKLPAYAWPGGYPIWYLTESNAMLCPGCADEARQDMAEPKVVDWDINYEDEIFFCYECNGRVESAYGEDEDDTGDLWKDQDRHQAYFGKEKEPYFPEVDVEFLKDTDVEYED